MPFFNHEELPVYQQSISLVTWVTEILQDREGLGWISERLTLASSSVVLGIAQGTGRVADADKRRFYDQAWGAALECAACLDVLVARKAINPEKVKGGKELLQSIVSTLATQVAQ